MAPLRRSNLSHFRYGNYLKCLARLPLTWENDRLEHIDFLRLNLPKEFTPAAMLTPCRVGGVDAVIFFGPPFFLAPPLTV